MDRENIKFAECILKYTDIVDNHRFCDFMNLQSLLDDIRQLSIANNMNRRIEIKVLEILEIIGDTYPYLSVKGADTKSIKLLFSLVKKMLKHIKIKNEEHSSRLSEIRNNFDSCQESRASEDEIGYEY